MSNSCFYSFCLFVKAGCAVWLQAHPDSRAGGDALREQMGRLQAAPREMVPGCQLPPRSREPGPLGMLAERDKLTLQAAFLLSDLKKKKKKHLGIIFPQWQEPQKHWTRSQMTWTWAAAPRFWAMCPQANCFTPESLFLHLYHGEGVSLQRSHKN